MMSPLLKREAVTVLMDEHSFGARRACGLVQISASLYRYCSRERSARGEASAAATKAATKRRYGYRGVHILLRRERRMAIRKLTCRLHREANH